MKLRRWKLLGSCYISERKNYLPDHWVSAMEDLHCGSGICEVYRPAIKGYKKEDILEKLKSLSCVDEVVESVEIEVEDATIIAINYISEGQWQTFVILAKKLSVNYI